MKKLLVAVFGIICFTGCATILGGGGEQNIQFVSQDPEATPKVNIVSKGGSQSVELPSTLNVKRSKQDILVTVQDECYKKNTQSVSSNINNYFLLNILFGGFGLFSSTTDAITGAMWEYDNTAVIYTTPNETCKAK